MYICNVYEVRCMNEIYCLLIMLMLFVVLTVEIEIMHLSDIDVECIIKQTKYVKSIEPHSNTSHHSIINNYNCHPRILQLIICNLCGCVVSGTYVKIERIEN
jgi:hypothetical protein